MSFVEKVAEIERTIDAILAGESGWPSGYWDPTIETLEARIAVLNRPGFAGGWLA